MISHSFLVNKPLFSSFSCFFLFLFCMTGGHIEGVISRATPLHKVNSPSSIPLTVKTQKGTDLTANSSTHFGKWLILSIS